MRAHLLPGMHNRARFAHYLRPMPRCSGPEAGGDMGSRGGHSWRDMARIELPASLGGILLPGKDPAALALQLSRSSLLGKILKMMMTTK